MRRNCSLRLDMNTCTMDIESCLHDRRIIHSDPEIMSGIPVFVGTTFPSLMRYSNFTPR